MRQVGLFPQGDLGKFHEMHRDMKGNIGVIGTHVEETLGQRAEELAALKASVTASGSSKKFEDG